MIHHNNVTAAASTHTSTTRVNFQVCLVPLPASILESSTGLRTGQSFTGIPLIDSKCHTPCSAPGHPSCAWEGLCLCVGGCYACTVAYTRHVTSTLPPNVHHHRCPCQRSSCSCLETTPYPIDNSPLAIAWLMMEETSCHT